MTKSYGSEVVVVSGASTGLGAATARALAADGFHVLAGVRREADGGAIRSDRVEPVVLDVTDAGHLELIAAQVQSLGKPLRAVVNNAGLAAVAPVETMPLDAWRSVFEVNVFGLVGLTQALLPALRLSKGRVVNITSIGGKVSTPTGGAYSGSKFAAEAISDALRREVVSQGVQVVIVEPGGMKTEMGARGTAAAHDQLALMTPEQKKLYATTMQQALDYAATFDTSGTSADDAAKTVVEAVTSRRPRVRYTIGREAAMLTRGIRLLPDRALDRMIATTMRRSSKV